MAAAKVGRLSSLYILILQNSVPFCNSFSEIIYGMEWHCFGIISSSKLRESFSYTLNEFAHLLAASKHSPCVVGPSAATSTERSRVRLYDLTAFPVLVR